MASAASDFDPATTASPAARSSAASSRPCRDIHTLCQVSISTAKPRMPALNTSWPLPPNSSDNPPVNSATTQAPSTPAATPPAIHSAAARHARGHGHDDADDQAGFENFTEDDQQRGKHGDLTSSFDARRSMSRHHQIALGRHGGNRRRNCSGRAAAAAHRRRPRCRPGRSSRNADRCFRIRRRS